MTPQNPDSWKDKRISTLECKTYQLEKDLDFSKQMYSDLLVSSASLIRIYRDHLEELLEFAKDHARHDEGCSASINVFYTCKCGFNKEKEIYNKIDALIGKKEKE